MGSDRKSCRKLWHDADEYGFDYHRSLFFLEIQRKNRKKEQENLRVSINIFSGILIEKVYQKRTEQFVFLLPNHKLSPHLF